MTQTAETVAPIAQKTASAMQHGGTAIAAGAGAKVYVFGFSADEWTAIAAIVGVSVAVIGLICTQGMNWYFGTQRLKIEREKALREFYDE
jgi:hypothetical protein